MAKLPSPITIGDEYLAVLLDELRGLRADLALARAPAVVKVDPVELREPEAALEALRETAQPPAKSLLQRITRR